MLIVFTVLSFLLIPMLDNIFTIAFSINRNLTFSGTTNDMQLSEEQYNDLNGIYDYDDGSSQNVRLNDNWFMWPHGIIPYVFDNSKVLEQVDKNRVVAIMDKINLNLPNCILFRFNNLNTYLIVLE